MGDIDLLDEIDDLKERLDVAETALVDLRDERDLQLEEYEFKIVKITDDLEELWKGRMDNLDRENREKTDALMAALDSMRLAFSGDSSGWIENKTKSGEVYYENSDTGEVQDTEPESLYIAKAMRKIEEAETVMVDYTALKIKYKDLEIKKKEADLIANKAKTEMNSLRSVDKSWRESAKTVFLNLTDMKNIFESQCDQVVNTLSAIGKVSARVHQRIPVVYNIKTYVGDLQGKNRKLASVVGELNSKIRILTTELEDRQHKIDRLSYGIEEEIERLTKPMREKLAECMTLVMKEKANRAQERKEIATMWPQGVLMPSVLMKYRDLSTDEKNRRLKSAVQKSADLALSLEIRANVIEKKMWELKYDDYGRPYYQHKKTGESNWDVPEILSYEPPPGRDEDGNLIEKPVEDLQMWSLQATNKGEVCFKHKETGEITYTPPYAYPKIPKGKTTDEIVSEAASIVIKYIKSKISTHIKRMTKIKYDLDHPLTPDEKKRKEKEEKNKARFEVKTDDGNIQNIEEDIESEDNHDLSLYLYDIETVEMIASKFAEDKKKKALMEANPELGRQEERNFMSGSDVRSFDVGLYSGPTLYETDVSCMSIDEIRGLVEQLATCEEKLDMRLRKTRDNLKDFSFVLMERIKDYQRQKVIEQRRLAEERARRDKQREREERRRIKKKLKRDRDNVQLVDEDNGNDNGIDNGIEGGVEEYLNFNQERGDGEDVRMKKRTKNSQLDKDQNQDMHQSEGQGVVGTDMSIITDELYDESYVDNRDEDAGDDGDEFDSEADDEDQGDGDLQAVNVEGKSVASELTGHDHEPWEPGHEPDQGNDQSNDLHLEIGTMLIGDPDFGADDNNESYSEDIIAMSTHMVNLSLFCGFTNTHMDDSPDFVTKELNDNDLQYNKYRDDKWLTASFYLANTKERIDAIRELTSRPYDPILGLLNTSPLEAMRLSHDGLLQSDIYYTMNSQTNSGNKPIDITSPDINLTRPWIQAVNDVNEPFKQRHAFWRSRQLMAEVMRYQLQQEALREASDGRLRESLHYPNEIKIHSQNQNKLMSLISTDNKNFDRTSNSMNKPVMVKVKNIRLKESVTKTWSDLNGSQHVQFVIGGWVGRSNSQVVTGLPLVWGDMEDDISLMMSLDRLRNDDIRIEVYDDNKMISDSLLGMVTISLCDLIGVNMGRDVLFKLKLSNRQNKYVADIEITLIAFYPEETSDKEHKINDNDPTGLMTREILLSTSPNPVGIKLHQLERGQMVDELSSTYPSLDVKMSSFGNIVSDLRGDGDDLMHMLIGDVTLPSLLNKGHRINEFTVKALPDLQFVKEFIQKKGNVHSQQVARALLDIEETYKVIEESIIEKFETSQKVYKETKEKYEVLTEKSEVEKMEMLRVGVMMNEISIPRPLPKTPEFPDLPELSYVPRIPNIGGLDARGKKLKNIPGKIFKEILVSIDNGEHDAKDWNFGEFWPSKQQIEKLQKQFQGRNSILDAQREEEMGRREKVMGVYREDGERWDIDEKKRKQEHQKIKKDNRKVNLKYFCCMERVDRMYKEFTYVQIDAETFRELKDLHSKSIERFKSMRIKNFMESERQMSSLEMMKRRLLKALDARKRALDLPAGANSKLEYDYLCRQSEEALRCLRVEVYECKEMLLTEGVRLRTYFQEEYSCCINELNRSRMFRDVIIQRVCVDKILGRNRYEVLHLMESMEKLRMIEAEKDDRGTDTVDDLGEVYKADKVWESPEIGKCGRLIDLVLNKINLMESVATTAVNCQKCLLESISIKWGVDFTPVRDSWVENSDYERAKKLYVDLVQWIAVQSQRLSDREKRMKYESEELKLQLEASFEQADIGLQAHDFESHAMARSASDIVTVLQNQLDVQRESTKDMQSKLETNITDLSRECQQVREDLLAQALAFEEKMKVLWAIISTMQATVQNISTKMDVFMEERDRIVIQSRLECDKLRGQLRRERKHSSYLLFIVHSHRGFLKYYKELLQQQTQEAKSNELKSRAEKYGLRRDVWEQVFVFSRLCTDVDSLFEFFATRLANLAGSRKSINEAMASNGAAVVLAALCKSPKQIIRKCAARALAGMGWDGYVETRILLWDCVMYWKVYKSQVLKKEDHAFKTSFDAFAETGTYDALLTVEPRADEFVPSSNMSLRTIIKQRRQWALRASKRNEGPNFANQKLINMKDGVIPALLQLCLRDGSIDWEISRNASLAISVASYEPHNHHDMINDQACIQRLLTMCHSKDPEVQTHAAITIANLCHKDEHSQTIFGNSGAIPDLLFMCDSFVVDVLEASTAALSNLTCFCDSNCQTVIEADGVNKMVKLIVDSFSENLLDLDQNDEVQANAVEMLANTSRYCSDETNKYFDKSVIDALVVMCASKNKQVKRHAPLVLGNISQIERCREEIGARGGIEAMFLVLEDPDATVKANTIWALCNLMWHPPNQERAGRFMAEIIEFLKYESGPVRTYGSTLLANTLYYNNANRVRFLEMEGSIELILSYISMKEDRSVIEGCLRSLLSLSYLDQVSLWLGMEGKHIPLFLDLLKPPFVSRDSMRYSLEVLCNLCVHHENRKMILDCNGIDYIVSLHGDSDKHVSDLSVQVVGLLEDVTPPEVLARRKANVGLERMITLAADSDPLVRAVAAESIGEEIWHDPTKQKRALQTGGVDVLLGIVSNSNEPVESLLPALWSLRNLMHSNFEAQNQFSFRDGILVVISTLGRCVIGTYYDQTEKLIEACLACLATAIINHEKNSRRLLVVGLEVVMDLADSKYADVNTGASYEVRNAAMGESVIALSKAILLMLGPYNYVVCRNCFKKQDLKGTNCVHCGHRLRVEVFEKDTLSPTKLLRGGDTVKPRPSSSEDVRAGGGNKSQSVLRHGQSLTGSPLPPALAGIKDLKNKYKKMQLGSNTLQQQLPEYLS